MEAKNKQTSQRDLILHQLVIPDLEMMESTGRYDRNVLLWLQEQYVAKAMKEHIPELMAFNKEVMSRDDMGVEEKWDKKTEFLGKITAETYSTLKADGKGFDLKNYVDAAKTFYEAESQVYAGKMHEVAAYIKDALANGIKPDIEAFARDAYLSMSRMSKAITNLESIGKVDQIASMMKQGIARINDAVVVQAGQSIEVGREVLKVVQQIAKAPDKYFQYVDSYKLAQPKASSPWDFEPERNYRSDPSFA